MLKKIESQFMFTKLNEIRVFTRFILQNFTIFDHFIVQVKLETFTIRIINDNLYFLVISDILKIPYERDDIKKKKNTTRGQLYSKKRVHFLIMFIKIILQKFINFDKIRVFTRFSFRISKIFIHLIVQVK